MHACATGPAASQNFRRRIAPTQLRSRAIELEEQGDGNENSEVRAGRLAQRAICLWLSLRAKQEMLLLLADEVRPCLVSDEFSEVGRRAVSCL